MGIYSRKPNPTTLVEVVLIRKKENERNGGWSWPPRVTVVGNRKENGVKDHISKNIGKDRAKERIKKKQGPRIHKEQAVKSDKKKQGKPVVNSQRAGEL